ncbi:phage terminase small subunit P27 family [Gorillibacterium sp. sgz5001074]|uniref:phage terminase small subunit P27 family n=1 Tax=Gorillibacterium sp. sgz5001074 TaxID=3446695 RepID=UPI003F67AD6A
MPGRRQPINLLLLKGKKHLTKAEIEERKKSEVKAPADKVKPPSYLPTTLRKEFKKIADELLKIDVISNLDVDTLARFVLAREQYLRITELLRDTNPLQTAQDEQGNWVSVGANPMYAELLLSQDKLFKQCRQTASDLGLTISSRCRLVVPKPEAKGETEFDKRFREV